MFTSTDGESIESYYHSFSKLMNDFKRNKHFPEKIVSNLKFLNNLQPEWRRHVTIVHQTKDLHTAGYTQLYDFLKYNQKEVDEQRAERLGKTHDPLALMATSNYPVFYQDQPSPSTYIQQPLPNNNYNPQPSFNIDFMQQPMPNSEDISDPTTAMNMAFALMAKAFKLNYSTPTNNNQGISSNPRNRQIAQPGDLDEMEEVDANCILMANLQQASTSEEKYTDLLEPIPEPHQVQQNDNVISDVPCVEQTGGTVEQCPALYDSLYNNLAIEIENVNSVNRNLKATNVKLTTELDRYKNQEKCFEISQEKYDKLDPKIHNWSSTTHREIHKVLKDEIFPIVNQVDARIQNFEIQFLKEAAKFVRDFKSLSNKADEYLDKQKTLEREIDRLLRAVVSQEIMSVVKNNSVIDTSNLQTELDRTKERFENYIIQKENEYAKLWNEWHTKCKECKYDKILYDKAYNDMHQKIERLQAQLGDLKGKCEDTPGVSNTLDLLSQKLKNENVELEFQVMNYVREIEHLKKTYKNLFDSISVTRAQTKTLTGSLQTQLKDSIYENAKLRAQLFDKVSERKDTTNGTSANTLFAKQSILGKPPSYPSKSNLHSVTPFPKSSVLPKVDKINALSKPVTSNSIPAPHESKVMKDAKVIAPRMFRINPSKTSREDKFVPINKVRVSVRTNPTTISQPHVITKKEVNSDSNGLSFTRVNNTAKTRRPQPRSNTKNDRVTSVSKSYCSKNKQIEVEEHHRNFLLSKKMKHMSSECNNNKLAIRNVKSKDVYAMCKQCLISANHDACVLNYVNDMNSRGKKQKSKVSKPKNVGANVRLASHKPRKPRTYLRWSPTGRSFDLTRKIIESNNVESHSDCSNGDNACTSNPQEPKSKRFPNSTFSLAGHSNLFMVRRLGMFKAHDRKSKGFGDLQWGNILITRVYFIEGLGHNLFSVGQFCDSDLEVAFRKNTCFVRNPEGVDLLKGNRTTNLYTINLHEMASASLICLMARATSTKSWLWHQRLSHLNFDTINDLARNDL
ncbi:retrovirus-related pol polyprotein from transposon TNT 1-94, partial [Tanacetum coccineum]